MRRTLITGATSGIGHALVTRLGGSDRITAVGRNQAILDQLRGQSGVDEVRACDLRDPKACATLMESRSLDVLVNNAGVFPSRAAFGDVPMEALDAMIDINLRSVLHLTHAALRTMRRQGHGHLVFIGSSAGRYPQPGSTVYGATKAAISLFVDALRTELVGERIRVSEIVPGRVRSNLYQEAMGAAARELYDGYEPLEAENIADAVAYALDAPMHVDVTRLEVFPTMQAVGGARIVKSSDIKARQGE